LREEIRRSFDEASRDEEHFPSTIDPRIQHVQVLLKFFGDLTDKCVLDVGCGKGRFARVLEERFPGADIWGLDISEEMLRFVPTGVKTRAGSMTELPFAASAFDCVYATESLEHAVEIERERNVPRAETWRQAGYHRQECRALGPVQDSGVGTVVQAEGTGRPAAAGLRRGAQRVSFLLGRCRAGRVVYRLVCNKVVRDEVD
jgi:SAM-dependent methyltransferase